MDGDELFVEKKKFCISQIMYITADKHYGEVEELWWNKRIMVEWRNSGAVEESMASGPA